MDWILLVPLANGLVYTIGTLFLKRATNAGVGPWRTTFVSNLLHGLLALPLWFIGPPLSSPLQLLIPLLISLSFFGGQLLTCVAIHRGAVSVVTPVMGVKPVFVAFIAIYALGTSLSAYVWAAAGLSAIAVFLLKGKSEAERQRILASIFWGGSASLLYAVYDVMLQKYGGDLGFENMMSAVFAFNALWSFALIPLFRSPVSLVPKKIWYSLAAGGTLVGLQAISMGWVLTKFGRVTEVNIIYSSRGIWSVLIVWILGHWFANREREAGRGEMTRRLLGALIMIAAIFLTMIA
ncbi:EamA family transporter [Puniceicoccaceae bacterium K14]|nr:EamA family transporter [Puniceicoccaceae bacterium K14]